MKNLRVPVCVILLLSGLICFGENQSTTNSRNVLTTVARLQPIDPLKIEEISTKYKILLSATTDVAVYWHDGWGENGALFIQRSADEAYRLTIEEDVTSRSDQRTNHSVEIDLETILARRIVNLIKFEIGRTGRDLNERWAADVTIYSFSIPQEPQRTGETQGMTEGTTVSALCRLIRSLAALPSIRASDRAGAINTIDRDIAAIEAAYGVYR